MDFSYYLISFIAVLISLAIHEYCHAYAAYKLGDNTAKNLGRLTLNPIKHINPFGALCILIFHIGWAKPVPINARNFKNPKKGFAITAVAGPLANIVISFISVLLYFVVLTAFGNKVYEDGSFALRLIENTLLFLALFHRINLGLGIFNLLPIPPFDGSRILHIILPPKLYFGIMKYERKIYYGVIIWLIFGDYAASALRMIPIVRNVPVLNFIVGILDLSNIISTSISFISGLMIDFWQLFPMFR